MVVRACIAVLLLLAGAMNLAAADSQLRLEFVDSFGNPVQAGVQVSIFEGSNLVARSISNPAVLRVPYGKYRLRAECPGFELLTKTITVSEPDQSMRVGLLLGKVGDPEPPGLVLAGNVHPCSAASQTWVKVIGLFTDEVGEARVQANCQFRMPNLGGGYYLAFVLHEGSVRDAKVIKVTAETPPVSFAADGPRIGGTNQ